jgi:hypothetical protein
MFKPKILMTEREWSSEMEKKINSTKSLKSVIDLLSYVEQSIVPTNNMYKTFVRKYGEEEALRRVDHPYAQKQALYLSWKFLVPDARLIHRAILHCTTILQRFWNDNQAQFEKLEEIEFDFFTLMGDLDKLGQLINSYSNEVDSIGDGFTNLSVQFSVVSFSLARLSAYEEADEETPISKFSSAFEKLDSEGKRLVIIANWSPPYVVDLDNDVQIKTMNYLMASDVVARNISTLDLLKVMEKKPESFREEFLKGIYGQLTIKEKRLLEKLLEKSGESKKEDK